MKTLGSLLLLTTLLAFCAGRLYAASPDGSSFKGYKVNCTEYTGKGCKEIYAPVCGIDGKTYSNNCELCLKNGGPNANVCAKHKGKCDMVGKKLDCPVNPSGACTMDLMYHCGSNGPTYGNKCDYCNHQVKNDDLTLLWEEHCYFGQPLCE